MTKKEELIKKLEHLSTLVDGMEHRFGEIALDRDQMSSSEALSIIRSFTGYIDQHRTLLESVIHDLNE